MKVLDVDPDLGEGLDPERLATARRDIRAATLVLPSGELSGPQFADREWPRETRLGPGLLVLGGLLVRRVELQGRAGAELLGPGDLLRPWQREDSIASISRGSAWRALDQVTIAVLDLGFSARLGPYPEIVAALVACTLRRARQLAITLAIVSQPGIDRRLLVLLWQMADRWGRVGPDGVLLPMRLPHAVLAEALAARRPTVTTALGGLEGQGLISRRSDGWLLHGSPPEELRAAPVG